MNIKMLLVASAAVLVFPFCASAKDKKIEITAPNQITAVECCKDGRLTVYSDAKPGKSGPTVHFDIKHLGSNPKSMDLLNRAGVTIENEK